MSPAAKWLPPLAPSTSRVGSSCLGWVLRGHRGSCGVTSQLLTFISWNLDEPPHGARRLRAAGSRLNFQHLIFHSATRNRVHSTPSPHLHRPFWHRDMLPACRARFLHKRGHQRGGTEFWPQLAVF